MFRFRLILCTSVVLHLQVLGKTTASRPGLPGNLRVRHDSSSRLPEKVLTEGEARAARERVNAAATVHPGDMGQIICHALG